MEGWKNEIQSREDATREAEERRDERDNAVYGLEQAIKEQRREAIECGGDEIGSITVSRELAGSEELGKYCDEKVEQVNNACAIWPGMQ